MWREEGQRGSIHKNEAAPHTLFIQPDTFTSVQSDSQHYQCSFPAHYPEFLQTLCLSWEMFSCALVYLSQATEKIQCMNLATLWTLIIEQRENKQ